MSEYSLTGYRLNPIQKDGERRYISPTALLRRAELRRSVSRIPMLAGVQLAQLERELQLAERSARDSIVSKGGRSLENLLEVSRRGLLTLADILIQQHSDSDDELSSLPKETRSFHFEKQQAHSLARSASAMLHVASWNAYEWGRGQPGATLPDDWRQRLRDLEIRYRHALAELRNAAIDSNVARVGMILRRLVEMAYGDLRSALILSARVGKRASTVGRPRDAVMPILGSVLARRCAMLAGATILVAQRVCATRSRTSTRKVAERRETLRRKTIDLEKVDLSLEYLNVGDSINVIGCPLSVEWEERPGKPVSVVGLKGITVIAPHKSLRRQGLTPGAWGWFSGTVQDDGNQGRYLEIEQEGPTTHAGEIWEDWLVTEVRSAYDLYPGSLMAEWEFPVAGHFGSKMDYLTRVSNAVEVLP